ncbi:MAG: hypothetical protein RL215_1615 [Planctomycetota bacterium]
MFVAWPADGAGYHALTAIFKKGAEKPWFFHEIVSIERLTELPSVKKP